MAGMKNRICVALAVACGFCGPVAGDELAPNGPHAFELHLQGLDSTDIAKFNYGRGLFHHNISSIVHADGTRTGLGPYFNANSCGACHIRDGRGPMPSDPVAVGFVLKLGMADTGGGGVPPHPVMGAQLQTQGLDGVGEGGLSVDYAETIVGLADGDVVRLRAPGYGIVGGMQLGTAPDMLFGPRVAPPVFGMGLIAMVPDEAIAELEDPDDRDVDGISGRANRVVDPVTGLSAIGRFGWKAATPSLSVQTQTAALRDMGLSSPLFDAVAGDCTPAETACMDMAASPDNSGPEFATEDIVAIVNYLHLLGFPQPRDTDVQDVAVGRGLFASIGCTDCHVPELRTGTARGAFAALANREVPAYTDLLVHDMGGGLADGFAEAGASGSEWRTAPLWGIGLTSLVNGEAGFLHDGRARTISEAIVWHGGEAQRSRDIFVSLSKASRDRVLAFLNSL